MRRGRTAAGVAIVAAALLVASGCAPGPAVGDGVLGPNWAVMPTPVVPSPKSDVCWPSAATTVAWDIFASAAAAVKPVDCTAEHRSETYFVGRLSADESAAPEVGDDLYRQAYEVCAKQANEFLGADFRTARVAIIPVVPTQRQWDGEARWYRCEMLEIATASGAIAPRTTSLRDGLRETRPLAMTCANEKLTADKKYVEDITFVGCDIAHDVEMTGVYPAPDGPYPGDDQLQTKALDACYGLGATYLGLSRSALESTGGVSWTAWGGGEDRWFVGDRAFWCFMGEYSGRKLTGSIKGRRPGSFPH